MSGPDTPDATLPADGRGLARGVMRMLYTMGHACLPEMVPVKGLRADVLSLCPNGEIWIVECKSGLADYRADRKWQGYLPYCDRFFWAVSAGFPQDVLGLDAAGNQAGLILADSYGADVARMAGKTPLAPARRARLVRDMARTAALRLHHLSDPGGLIAG